MSGEAEAQSAGASVAVIACRAHWIEAREFLDIMQGLAQVVAFMPLDTCVMLGACLPRRYGGGTGAGLQLALPLCAFCELEGEGPPDLEKPSTSA